MNLLSYMSLKLSNMVNLTRAMAQDERISYSTAASRVLRSKGFARPQETTVSDARIVNDIGADSLDTLCSAVLNKFRAIKTQRNLARNLPFRAKVPQAVSSPVNQARPVQMTLF